MLELMRRTIAGPARDGARGDPQADRGGLRLPELAEPRTTSSSWARGSTNIPRTADGDYAAEEPLLPARGQPAACCATRTARCCAAITSRRSCRRPRAATSATPSWWWPSPTCARASTGAAYMDYVGVKRYGADGQAFGEVRFVGLFTAEAYEAPARDVPLIRRKVDQRHRRAPARRRAATTRSACATSSRPIRATSCSRSSEDELLRIALGILHLYDRPRVRLFARARPVRPLRLDPAVRAARALRRPSSRERAGEILAEAFGGRVSASYPSFSDAPLARVHYIIGVTPGRARRARHRRARGRRSPRPRAPGSTASRTRCSRSGATRRRRRPTCCARYADAFPAGYRDRYDADEALADIAVIEAWPTDEPIRVRAYRTPNDTKLQFRFKLYREGEAPRRCPTCCRSSRTWA